MSEQMFKAWDNKNKNWLEHFLIDEIGRVFTIDWENHLIKNIDATLCMSTNYKDEEGKIMYHGDIIKRFNVKKLCFIEWDCKLSKFYTKDIGANSYDPIFSYDYSRKCKIIGNIFEHKHLLEKLNA